jgi:hypothetical protein
MAYLARDCIAEHTVVDHFNLFLKEYDTCTRQDHSRMDLPTLNCLQNALERIIKQTPQEIDDILKTLRSGDHNTWLLLHIETTGGMATSLTSQELESMNWLNSPAFDSIANRRIALYTLGLVPVEWELLMLFYQSSSFTTHFSLLCLLTKMSSSQSNESLKWTNLSRNLLERIDVVVAATFKVDQTGTVRLVDYLILVEHLQPRWKALPKPWRSTFATLLTRRTETVTWIIEVAHCLMIELRERDLERSIPQRILSAQLPDSFIPDDAYSLSGRLQIQGGTTSPEGPAAILREQQIGRRYLNSAAALLPFISEMLREVNTSPPGELWSLYASLLSLPDLFGDRACRHHIMTYVEGIFDRVQMISERLGTVPVTSRQGSERGWRGGSRTKKRGRMVEIREFRHPDTT